MIRLLLAFILLTLLYAGLVVSFEPWDWAMGAAISLLLVIALRTFVLAGDVETVPLRHLFGRFVAFFPFVAAVLGEVITGTWQVILVVLNLRARERAGIVHVPIGERSRRGVAATAWALTLSPGNVLVAVDWDERAMLIHVLDATDPAAVCARQERFYQRYQKPVIP